MNLTSLFRIFMYSVHIVQYAKHVIQTMENKSDFKWKACRMQIHVTMYIIRCKRRYRSKQWHDYHIIADFSYRFSIDKSINHEHKKNIKKNWNSFALRYPQSVGIGVGVFFSCRPYRFYGSGLSGGLGIEINQFWIVWCVFSMRVVRQYVISCTCSLLDSTRLEELLFELVQDRMRIFQLLAISWCSSAHASRLIWLLFCLRLRQCSDLDTSASKSFTSI